MKRIATSNAAFIFSVVVAMVFLGRMSYDINGFTWYTAITWVYLAMATGALVNWAYHVK